MTFKRFIILFMFVALLSGCATIESKISKAVQSSLEADQISGSVSVSKNPYFEKYVYDVYISSTEFNKLSVLEMKNVIKTLEDVSIDELTILTVYVISDGAQYSLLGDDDTLYRDGSEFPPKPTEVPFVMPSGDFSMSWDTYNNTYNSLGGIMIITRTGDSYSMRLVMNDGSSGNYALTVVPSNDGYIWLTEDPGNSFGDHMYINDYGDLVFADHQGYIYSAPRSD